MAPIKQEEQIKDKLEKRSLQPSPESWATLANRLDVEQKIKNNSMFWWFGIAASIIGIVFVSAIYFNNNSVENNTTIIVETNDNVTRQNENQQIKVSIKDEEVAVEDVNPIKNDSNESKPTSTTKTIVSEENQTLNTLFHHEVVVQNENAPSQLPLDKVTDIKTSTFSFEEQKIQDVVAQINNLKSTGNAVTDAEIDSLLKKAQKEILSNRLYNEKTRTVDANALLQDVEEDLQQSFRSKVFEALQSGYESVRTAVAERNN